MIYLYLLHFYMFLKGKLANKWELYYFLLYNNQKIVLWP